MGRTPHKTDRQIEGECVRIAKINGWRLRVTVICGEHLYWYSSANGKVQQSPEYASLRALRQWYAGEWRLAETRHKAQKKADARRQRQAMAAFKRDPEGTLAACLNALHTGQAIDYTKIG